MDSRKLDAGQSLQFAEESIYDATPEHPEKCASESDQRARWRWIRPLRDPNERLGASTDQSARGRQVVKIGQLARRFKGDWKISKNRRFHCDGKEYSVDLAMVHPDHGIALVSVCPSEYALPDLAIDILRDVLVQAGIPERDVAVLPIVFVSAFERSMQEVADDIQQALLPLPAPPAAGWEKRVYKILSSPKYDRLADGFGAEIINPSNANRRGSNVPKALPMLPAPVVLYFACSGVGVVAGIAATVVVLLH